MLPIADVAPTSNAKDAKAMCISNDGSMLALAWHMVVTASKLATMRAVALHHRIDEIKLSSTLQGSMSDVPKFKQSS